MDDTTDVRCQRREACGDECAGREDSVLEIEVAIAVFEALVALVYLAAVLAVRFVVLPVVSLACCAAVEDGSAVAADFCYWIFGSVELEAGFAACDGNDRGMLGCWCGEFDLSYRSRFLSGSSTTDFFSTIAESNFLTTERNTFASV